MKLKMTKTIRFRDMNGNLLHTLHKGEEVEYTAEVNDTYYVTSLGGVYRNEAQPIAEPEVDVSGWNAEDYLSAYSPPDSLYVKKK